MTSASLRTSQSSVAASSLSSLDESGVLKRGLTLVAANNATVTLVDSDGSSCDYTDLISAFAAVNFGHNNPDIRVQLEGPDIAAYFYPAETEIVAAWLTTHLQLSAHKVLFQVGGSFAVSTALALGQHRKPGAVVAVEGGYHGLGVDALSVGTVQREYALQRSSWSTFSEQQVTILPHGAMPDWDGVSSLIYEPIQGANGYVALRSDWLAELEAEARDAGVTIIADEIQSGFYRHGFLSVARSRGLEPDILLFSKSLTNGIYPLSAVVYNSDLLGRDIPTPRLAHTFQMGVLGYKAAAAVASWLDTAPVDDLVAEVSALLQKAAAEISNVDGVRRVEVNGATLSFQPTAISAATVAARCFEAGVMVFTGGHNGERIRVAPPLTIPRQQLEESLAVVVSAVAD